MPSRIVVNGKKIIDYHKKDIQCGYDLENPRDNKQFWNHVKLIITTSADVRRKLNKQILDKIKEYCDLNDLKQKRDFTQNKDNTHDQPQMQSVKDIWNNAGLTQQQKISIYQQTHRTKNIKEVQNLHCDDCKNFLKKGTRWINKKCWHAYHQKCFKKNMNCPACGEDMDQYQSS